MLSLVGYLPPTANCLGHSVSYYLSIKEALPPHRLETALIEYPIGSRRKGLEHLPRNGIEVVFGRRIPYTFLAYR